MNLLELTGIKKQYHAKTALDGIDLCLGEGDFLTILGPNGAGKTTLLKIMSGIMSPSEGSVKYGNRSSPESDIRKEVSYLGHKNSLYNALSVLENLEFVSRLFSHRNGRSRVEDVLKDSGLWERRNDPVSELSQGMKRRLAIIKGVITEPKVFIMDEPFTGLDLRWRKRITSSIRKFREQGRSLVLTTHLVEEGYELADNIVFLHRGKPLFVKKKSDVKVEDIYDLFDSLGEAVK
jgi:heme ABC exporter ATP-binding subunit CcmA